MKPTVLDIEKTHIQKVYNNGFTIYEHVFLVMLSNGFNIETRMVSISDVIGFDMDEVVECAYLKYNETIGC